LAPLAGGSAETESGARLRSAILTAGFVLSRISYRQVADVFIGFLSIEGFTGAWDAINAVQVFFEMMRFWRTINSSA
jgi:hypothetical protein